MKLTLGCVSVLAISTSSFGFAFTSSITNVSAPRQSSKIIMMSKRRSATKGERKYIPTWDYVINPDALNDTGILLMNTKTKKIIQAPVPVVKAKPAVVEIGTLELYCKAGPDGKSLGDCPFTHYVNMVLQYKKLPFTLKPCGPNSKPEWLIEEHDGKMPCLVHNGEAYTESDEIVRYINYFFPKPELTNEYREKDIEIANEATSSIFPLMASCIKNLDSNEDSELIEEIMEELKTVDTLLEEAGGSFLCGSSLTSADCSFAPILYHLKTTLAQFKNTVIPPELVSLHKYMDTMFAHPAFVASSYPPDVIVWGWNKARGMDSK